MVSEQQIEDYRQQGFLVLGNFAGEGFSHKKAQKAQMLKTKGDHSMDAFLFTFVLFVPFRG